MPKGVEQHLLLVGDPHQLPRVEFSDAERR